jgi:hypothetical protein
MLFSDAYSGFIAITQRKASPGAWPAAELAAFLSSLTAKPLHYENMRRNTLHIGKNLCQLFSFCERDSA